MITYLFFKVFEHFKNEEIELNWQKTRALIATSGLLVSNILTIIFLTNTFFYPDKNLINTILTGRHFIDKFIILPILISPLFLIIYFLGWKKLDDKIEFYRNESINEKKRKGKIVCLYIIITFMLISISIFSPLIIK